MSGLMLLSWTGNGEQGNGRDIRSLCFETLEMRSPGMIGGRGLVHSGEKRDTRGESVGGKMRNGRR